MDKPVTMCSCTVSVARGCKKSSRWRKKRWVVYGATVIAKLFAAMKNDPLLVQRFTTAYRHVLIYFAHTSTNVWGFTNALTLLKTCNRFTSMYQDPQKCFRTSCRRLTALKCLSSVSGLSNIKTHRGHSLLLMYEPVWESVYTDTNTFATLKLRGNFGVC